LHTTSRYVVLRIIRGRRRREFREQQAVAMNTNAVPKINWDQLSPLLDEAVGQLNDRDRQAVLLRYFQGRSHREVGAAIGLNEDAARVRTDRAVEKLRRYFARSGVATTSALLAEVLATNSASAAPMGLVGKVQAASLASAEELGFGHTMCKLFFMNTKLILNATFIVLVVGGVASWLIAQSSTSATPTAQSFTSQTQASPTTQVELPKAKPVAAKTTSDQAAMAALTEAQKKDVAELNTLLASLAHATRVQAELIDFYAPKQLTSRGFTPEILAKIQPTTVTPTASSPQGGEMGQKSKDDLNMTEATAQAYEAMVAQIPKFNVTGDEAIYQKIDVTYEDMTTGTYSGTGEHSLLHFVKSSGKWYVNEDPGWGPSSDGAADSASLQFDSTLGPLGLADPFAPAGP
jgi:hypothetical protein